MGPVTPTGLVQIKSDAIIRREPKSERREEVYGGGGASCYFEDAKAESRDCRPPRWWRSGKNLVKGAVGTISSKVKRPFKDLVGQREGPVRLRGKGRECSLNKKTAELKEAPLGKGSTFKRGNTGRKEALSEK